MIPTAQTHQSTIQDSDGPCVIYHPVFGIYLHTLIGDWWSAVDACGAGDASTFKDRAAAAAFIQQCVSQPGYAPCRSWAEGEETTPVTDNDPTHYRAVRVVPDCDPFASQSACEAAGLPTWVL